MKYLIHLFAVIAVIALLTACTDVPKDSDTSTPLNTPTGVTTEVYIDVTDAPTEQASTDAPTESATSEDNNEKTASADAGSELVDHQWRLTKLYKDGEERQIYVEYGSVVRQTGTYITFRDDDTFECILGVTGCKGTYAVENSDVNLHITTKYGAKTEECDEYETAKWNHDAGTLTFDFNNITNVFTKGS